MTEPSEGRPPAAEATGAPAPADPGQPPVPVGPVAATSPMPTQPGQYPQQAGYPQPGQYPQPGPYPPGQYPQPGPYPPAAGYPPGAAWPPPGAPAPWPGQPAPGAPVGAPAPWASAAAMASSRAGSALAGLDRTGWRTTIAVALVMIGVFGGANLVNAVVPLPTNPGTVTGNPGQTGTGQPGTGPAQPGPVTAGQPTDVGSGVKIYAPAGWSVTQSQDGSTAFSRGSAVVIVTVGSFSGSPADLEKQYRAQFTDMQFSGSAPNQATMGSGIPAVAVVYTAVLQGKTQVDGIYVVGVSKGVGVVVNALAPQGQLQALSADISAIVGSVQVGG